jgi:hypothetical protein
MSSSQAQQAFKSALFEGEQLEAFTFAKSVGDFPESGMFGLFGVSDYYFGLTAWRLLEFQISYGALRTLPFENSEFLVQKKFLGKQLFLTRHFTQTGVSPESSAYSVYQVDKSFIDKFQILSAADSHIPVQLEKTVVAEDSSSGVPMVKCVVCGTMNIPASAISTSPWNAICLGCYRSFAD